MHPPTHQAVLAVVALLGMAGMLWILASHVGRGRQLHSLRRDVVRLRVEYLARLKAMDLGRSPDSIPAGEDEQIEFLLQPIQPAEADPIELHEFEGDVVAMGSIGPEGLSAPGVDGRRAA